jgi:hypothetical protein
MRGLRIPDFACDLVQATSSPPRVVAGFIPAIHVFSCRGLLLWWITGTGPVMTEWKSWRLSRKIYLSPVP